MAASEALSVQGESTTTAADPTLGDATAAPGRSAAAQRWPQLIPVAQLVAVVLGVFAIIWNQQQTTDSLRNELRDEISQVETGLRDEIAGLRDEISQVETGLRDEISQVETGLRAQLSENGQRLARIEGFLGIGIPDAEPE